ncbi:hypothetical protein OIV83_005970 [Microbotryomycetes sp. JL201]|nr:hypothetical protein OIV83_005970 [Microbotryomycetes sp. JL201]
MGSEKTSQSHVDNTGLAPGTVQVQRRRFGLGRFALEEEGSRTYLVVHTLQTFFSFIGVCIYIAIVAHQSKFDVGPSFLAVLGLLVNLIALLVGTLLLATPLMAERTGFFSSVDRITRQIRFSAMLGGSMLVLLFILCLATTISANVAGCKDPLKDPHADHEAYVATLEGFCRNKGAGAAFFWLAFFAWSLNLGLILLKFYHARKNPMASAFVPPTPSFQYTTPADEEAFDANDDRVDPFTDKDDRREPAGYRPSGDYYDGRLYDEEDAPPGYGRQRGDVYHPETRDPFEETGLDERAYEAHDPYEQIRRVHYLDTFVCQADPFDSQSMEQRSQTPKY